MGIPNIHTCRGANNEATANGVKVGSRQGNVNRLKVNSRLPSFPEPRAPLLVDIDNPVSFSPSGEQFAFVVREV